MENGPCETEAVIWAEQLHKSASIIVRNRLLYLCKQILKFFKPCKIWSHRTRHSPQPYEFLNSILHLLTPIILPSARSGIAQRIPFHQIAASA